MLNPFTFIKTNALQSILEQNVRAFVYIGGKGICFYNN